MLITKFLSPTFVTIGTFVCMPLIFFYSVAKFGFAKIFSLVHVRQFLFLVILMSVSVVVAKNLELYFTEMQRLIGVFFFVSGISILAYSNYTYIYIFYSLYILKILALFFYSYIFDFESNYAADIRYDSENLNANTFGYFSFFGIVSLFFLWSYFRKNKTINHFLIVLGVLLIGLAYFFITIAASRASIIILSMYLIITGLLSIWYNNRNKATALIKASLLLLVIFIFAFILYKKFISGTLLEQRMQAFISGEAEDSAGDERKELAVLAIKLGLENPVLGIGSGNFATRSHYGFSHNSFTELFVNNGVGALLLYLTIYYRFVKEILFAFKNKIISRYTIALFVSFLICWFFYEFFYVFYLDQEMFGFFFLVISHLTAINGKKSNSKLRLAPT